MNDVYINIRMYLIYNICIYLVLHLSLIANEICIYLIYNILIYIHICMFSYNELIYTSLCTDI